MSLDAIAIIVMSLAGSFALVTLVYMLLVLAQIAGKTRTYRSIGRRAMASFLLTVTFMASLGFGIYRIPALLGHDPSWQRLSEWAPPSLLPAAIILYAAMVIFYVYAVLIAYFPRKNEKPWFYLGTLSILGGVSNALIIFCINIAVAGGRAELNKMLLYFTLALTFYVISQVLVRKKLISIANELIYDKRMTMIDTYLRSPYEKLENVESGRIYSSLNNEMEVISEFANTLITVLTSSITLISCFVYLGVLNPYALLLLFCVLGLIVLIFHRQSGKLDAIWENVRDLQSMFLDFIQDMVGGSKELSINKKKNDQFRGDIEASCNVYMERRIVGEVKFAYVTIMSEISFIVIIGTVVFLFPHLFQSLDVATLQSFVYLFLFMIGPITVLSGAMPNMMQMKISWQRINQFMHDLGALPRSQPDVSDLAGADQTTPVTLELVDVHFNYTGDNGESFMVGPINLRFHSSEISFITGGNGSGKSTLAKLITGLYSPTQGEIRINGRPVGSAQLGEYFSTIFSDFYLFKRMYGVDLERKGPLVAEYLKLLRIEDKVEVKDDAFSTVKLSTGQRKRLAFLINYLEDKPLCLYDEWAADQDPEFRRYFYEVLLPELKKEGKCIIAITHDDAYFDLADQLVKMEFGKLQKVEHRKVRRTKPAELHFSTNLNA
ncbi:cyclic peptide export ABC transporter [Paenibacillus oleatilyticus]|uniref:cyclic peptide export ABC transporter n=1 Tax=Paenibacillus oleatilyticus TaxID=2594886 RepID=UPI001C1F3158|nr:cyclic peptide export ABC transporter [Paenibacillus oleatilyticus]MBU7314574.1 cyclic peptide export ABC transporter [Paenibacillus oleatilyticus]